MEQSSSLISGTKIYLSIQEGLGTMCPSAEFRLSSFRPRVCRDEHANSFVG